MSLLHIQTTHIQSKEMKVVRFILFPSFVLLVVPLTEAAGQRAEGASTVSVSAKVGGKVYEAAGAGSCKHEPQASIYGVPAALWMVEYPGMGNSNLKRANLTLWRPKDGSPDQLSVTLGAGSSSYEIRVGGRGKQVGSGKASLSPSGPGGRFEIKGKDAGGTPLTIVIKCATFAGIEAEGG